MEVGREEVRRGLQALERIAKANERLIELADQEDAELDGNMPVMPSRCPHCDVENPRVRNEGAAGNLNDIILVLHCENCAKQFFCIPQDLVIVKTPEEVRALMEAGT